MPSEEDIAPANDDCFTNKREMGLGALLYQFTERHIIAVRPAAGEELLLLGEKPGLHGGEG
jgi:hypothetical protein